MAAYDSRNSSFNFLFVLSSVFLDNMVMNSVLREMSSMEACSPATWSTTTSSCSGDRLTWH